MLTRARRQRWQVYLLALGLFVVGVTATQRAIEWYDHPIAGILVDPDLAVANIGWPTWDGVRDHLRFPDRVVAVDGQDLTRRSDDFPARAWDRAIEAADASGKKSVHVRVETQAGPREVDLAITHLNAGAWWVNAGGIIFSAIFYGLAGLIALATHPDGKLARTFASAAIVCSLFLFSFFDFHTTRVLVPVWHVAFAMSGALLIALAMRVPDDIKLLERHSWILRLVQGVGASLAIALLVRDVLHLDTVSLRVTCSLFLGASLVFFCATLVIRFFLARGARRATLRALLGGLVPVNGVIAIGVLGGMLTSQASTLAFYVFPAITLSPLAAVIAFIRHDLWGSRALLSRVLTNAVVATLACALGVALATALVAASGMSFPHATLATATGGVLSAALVILALRASDRGFFPSRAEYKPTIAHLSEELTELRDPQAVATEIERTVRRWLAADKVEFTLSKPGDDEEPVSEISMSAKDEFTLSIDFGGSRLGILRVGKKRGGALFTSEDIDLLQTISNQAALAVAHALSYRELEERRQQQAAAWRGERLALIETLTAEIAHEIRYPINYFRSVFYRRAETENLDPEEIEIGREEVDRLERLVGGLRRLSASRLERRAISLVQLASRAEVLLSDALGSRRLDVSIPEGVVLRCDIDQTTQIVVNLVSNALDATNSNDHVGIEWSSQGTGGELVIWDTGVGFDGDASQLFAPWFTTKPRGTGLGLAITQRIVRAHGWSIDARRERGRTRFVIAVPGSDVSEAPPRAPASEVA
jgi:signal transduction histidine kinase